MFSQYLNSMNITSKPLNELSCAIDEKPRSLCHGSGTLEDANNAASRKRTARDAFEDHNGQSKGVSKKKVTFTSPVVSSIKPISPISPISPIATTKSLETSIKLRATPVGLPVAPIPAVSPLELLGALNSPIDMCAAKVAGIFQTLCGAKFEAGKKSLEKLLLVAHDENRSKEARKLARKRFRSKKESVELLKKLVCKYGAAIDRDTLFDVTVIPVNKAGVYKEKEMIMERLGLAQGILKIIDYTCSISPEAAKLLNRKRHFYNKRIQFYQKQLSDVTSNNESKP